MATNKTIRRQQAAAALAAEQAPNLETAEEVTGDALDTSSESEVSGSVVIDQDTGLVEGDQPAADTAEGSDAPQAITEQPEGLVGDESDGPAVQFLENDEGRELATRDGLVVSDRGLTEFVTPVDELPHLPETPVSEEEQAASTATLLEQEPQPEPEAPAVDVAQVLADRTVKDMFDGADEATTPVGAAVGVVVAALEESVEDEQAALVAPEPEVVEPVAEAPVVEEGTEVDYTTYTTAQLRMALAPAVGKIPSEAWSREDMLLYLLKGVYPQKTGRNNWIYDARRAHRVKTWTHTEILDFIEGKLKLDPHVVEEEVWEEAYARYKVPASWTIDAFKEYVCNGSVPEYTASGLLVNDRQRDQKKPGHLTFREIRGALLGHIQTKFTHQELLSQYRKRLGISESYSEERLLAEMPNQPDEVSMNNTILRAKLDEYKTAITKNSGTQTEQTAGECQGMLYKAVREVLKREFNEFVEGWNIILDFVNENYTALFAPEKARRGWSQVALGKSQLQLFEDLLTVLIATREPGNRAKKQTYNLEIVLRHLPEENQRQNLFMYYAQ
jgi:hypothetical protein